MPLPSPLRDPRHAAIRRTAFLGRQHGFIPMFVLFATAWKAILRVLKQCLCRSALVAVNDLHLKEVEGASVEVLTTLYEENHQTHKTEYDRNYSC